METKTIKISATNYKAICGYAGELQKSLGEPVSIDKALTSLMNKSTLSDLAGSWKMSGKEAEDTARSIKKGWKKWTIESA